MRWYAGIGSRRTPPRFCAVATAIAELLHSAGYGLRSGHAPGADRAFETGACERDEIFVVRRMSPRHIVPPEDERYALATLVAATFHSAWGTRDEGARRRLIRDVYQIFGPALDDPVEFVLYWAKEDRHGTVAGGTAMGVALARATGIPAFNLGLDRHHSAMLAFFARELPGDDYARFERIVTDASVRP
jgi:hypothetical protein